MARHLQSGNPQRQRGGADELTLSSESVAVTPRARRWPARLIKACDGTSAIEMAFLLPTFLVFIFGVCEFGRALWTQSALQFAVEAAARCASVNTTTCGTTSQIQSYAASAVNGITVTSTSFNVTAPSCGNKVSINYTFTLLIPQLIPWSMTLKAQSCHP
jgi:Flp pilus assembly protein TadG